MRSELWKKREQVKLTSELQTEMEEEILRAIENAEKHFRQYFLSIKIQEYLGFYFEPGFTSVRFNEPNTSEYQDRRGNYYSVEEDVINIDFTSLWEDFGFGNLSKKEIFSALRGFIYHEYAHFVKSRLISRLGLKVVYTETKDFEKFSEFSTGVIFGLSEESPSSYVRSTLYKKMTLRERVFNNDVFRYLVNKQDNSPEENLPNPWERVRFIQDGFRKRTFDVVVFDLVDRIRKIKFK